MEFHLIQVDHTSENKSESGLEKLEFKINEDEKDEWILGRHSRTDFKIDSRAFPLFLSRRHARFTLEEKQLFVEDLQTTNGSYLNGVMLAPYTRHWLKHGDHIAFGCLRDDKPVPGDIVKDCTTPYRFLVIEANHSVHCDNDVINPAHRSPVYPRQGNSRKRRLSNTINNERRRRDSSNGEDSGIDDLDHTPFIKLHKLIDSQHNLDEPGVSHWNVGTNENKSNLNSSKTEADEEVEPCSSHQCLFASLHNVDENLISWVQCDSCDQWYHTQCVGCDYEQVKNSTHQFHCGFC
nr:uncharacterized protein LOC100185845 [Ciona intestinalis]|eukprot:XP_026692928.1 uncharacterized protein LOC100185845 [Ciona intestinalis]